MMPSTDQPTSRTLTDDGRLHLTVERLRQTHPESAARRDTTAAPLPEISVHAFGVLARAADAALRDGRAFDRLLERYYPLAQDECSDAVPAIPDGWVERVSRAGADALTPDELLRLLVRPLWLIELRQAVRDHSAVTDTKGRPAELMGIGEFVRRELRQRAASGMGPLGWDRTWRGQACAQLLRSAEEGGVVRTAQDTLAFHTAFVDQVRTLRRDAGVSTSNDATLPDPARREASRTVALMAAQDRALAALARDPKFVDLPLWYKCAEEAAMSNADIARLVGVTPEEVRDGLLAVRVEVEIELGA